VDGVGHYARLAGWTLKIGVLRRIKEKAPLFRVGMNPTIDYTATVQTLGRIFHARIRTFK
jgi:hypothetical protein